MKAISSLSVFFPAYNEEHNIKKTVESAIKVLNKFDFKWELIVVNDGSNDSTEETVKAMCKQNANVKLISQENGGYGSALIAGFENARHDWVVYTDADGQFDFAEINKFLQLIPQYDAVWGCKMKRKDPPLRLVLSWLWGFSLHLLFGLKLRDVNCGFKMIKRAAYLKIRPLQSKRGGMINAELAIKLKSNGYKIIEVEVNHFPRIAGRSTGGSLAVALSSYSDLLRLWWTIKFRNEKNF